MSWRGMWNRLAIGSWMETKKMSLWLETFHDPLSQPDWLVRILRPIVQAFMGAMLNTRHDQVPLVAKPTA
jgi:hypothetical protein